MDRNELADEIRGAILKIKWGAQPEGFDLDVSLVIKASISNPILMLNALYPAGIPERTDLDSVRGLFFVTYEPGSDISDYGLEVIDCDVDIFTV